MPIYIYFCIFSILCSLIANKKLNFNSSFFSIWILLNVIMLIQFLNLAVGIFNPSSLLLNHSTTDLLDLTSEFFTPTVDFTVIKHFVFFNVYYLFLFANFDYIRNRYLISKILTINNKLIFVLFCLIYFEFFVSALMGPDILDSISLFLRFDLNLKWVGPYGVYVVEGWLIEPSEIIITFPYFFCLAQKTDSFIKSFLLFAFGVGGVLMTGSTTGLMICGLCFLYMLYNCYKKKEKIHFTLLLVILLLVAIFAVQLLSSQINKLFQFLDFESNERGSATFRANSIYYAIISFSKAPLFGVGIGTVYCHGMIFQILSNLGIVGTILFIISYMNLFKGFRVSYFKIGICFLLLTASSLIQSFTSPYFLIVLFACFREQGKLVLDKKDNKVEIRFIKSIFNVYI